MRRYPAVAAARLLRLVLRLSPRRAGVILAYHTVASRHGDAAHELVPPVERNLFAEKLRHLVRHYDVVPLDRFLPAVAARRLGQRLPVCVTFDDDTPEHLVHAMPLLREHGVPATFFVAGAAATHGTAWSFWWQRLQRAADRDVPLGQIVALLPAEVREDVERGSLDIHGLAAAIQKLSPADRDRLAEDLLALAGPDPPHSITSMDDIAALRDAGFGLGFHTHRHDWLPGLDDRQLEQALRDQSAVLGSVGGKPLDAIAYPHGAADGRVADAARRAGFRLGLTCRRTPATPRCDPLLLGRFSDDTPSLEAFACGIALTLLRPQDTARSWRLLAVIRRRAAGRPAPRRFPRRLPLAATRSEGRQ